MKKKDTAEQRDAKALDALRLYRKLGRYSDVAPLIGVVAETARRWAIRGRKIEQSRAANTPGPP
ncbi:MAG TPA: hypothetical protein VMF91_08860 [Bryobacteraceae bacterium]|nr:hypothetical protein [Bryobacteraceae bacterium]